MQTCDTILHAGYDPHAESNPCNYQKRLACRQSGQIAAVGTRASVTKYLKVREEIDLGHVLLMPGLVNTHTHAA